MQLYLPHPVGPVGLSMMVDRAVIIVNPVVNGLHVLREEVIMVLPVLLHQIRTVPLEHIMMPRRMHA